MNILLIQGANMIWLGRREPHLYGTVSAAELDTQLQAHAVARNCALEIFYTNLEGAAIDRIYRAVEEGVDGLLMNPAGFTYAGYALRDCIRGARLPYVEVHITNLARRGTKSVTAPAANGYVAGLGLESYFAAFDGLLALLERSKAASAGQSR